MLKYQNARMTRTIAITEIKAKKPKIWMFMLV
jgi:hypothetical protein